MPELIINGPAGRIEARYHHDPASDSPIALILHPHPQFGGTMNNQVVYTLYHTFAERGFSVLRFNFRGVGLSQGTSEEGRGELEDFQAALDWMAARYPGLPLWAAGFSFGAWVALETGAADSRVPVLIGIAPPVNRPNYSFARTLETTKPKFLIQGSLDELCPLKEMWAFYAKLKEPRELVVIDGASHLFEGKTEEVGEAIADLLGDFE